MTLTYQTRFYVIRIACVLALLPILAFIFLIFKMPFYQAMLASMLIYLGQVPLWVMLFRKWDDVYVFNSDSVVYISREKQIWSIPVSDIKLSGPGLTVDIRHAGRNIRVYWITRKTFSAFLSQAGKGN